ncbi:heparinase II/III family protein [Vibrio coralliilyticus]|uniref:heparinase II/III family protein n=1 Tax=Vibrio coralliilyticus TaxID=190893 RepID=UPI0006CCC50F|nr:heparinase II/III family protein [Vibrio coralliilyticus]ANW24190.1 hypothetical protein BA953_08150 [Vibrio coralliilyticus]AXN32123.1 heparinase [Vibrio coralliilyticus]KPH26355.1 hypothetical protein ADU60_14270 [Vibrio coralliilyticus]
MRKLSLYFHTIKYLKFIQLYYRILKRLNHPKIKFIKAEPAEVTGTWQVEELYPQKFIDQTEVNFLNHAGSVHTVEDWNNPKEEKLWLYNLHYFDDLVSFGSANRRTLQLNWVRKWIEDNPALNGGNGWEPYTLSLRIVNWVKASLSGLQFDNKALDSLAQQADFLSQDLEKHLLGNHYFVNLKALIFVGCFFSGNESEKWLAIGLKDFEKELNEQVLNDGGSFELTPMYHAIMLTDLLDLYNLFQTFKGKVPTKVVELTKNTIVKMFSWLDIMSHGDDKISFFNDSAFGIAPDNSVLRDYARNLGISVGSPILSECQLEVYNLENGGYVSAKTDKLSLIADLAPVGPSYIPGHAHADSLSFEMALGDERVFVNSGTSLYGLSEERLRQRGTAAHNTVVVNQLNSSEVWSGFRVARRAEMKKRLVGHIAPDQCVEFSAEHNGYKKVGVNCIHKRIWKVSLHNIVITDTLKGEFKTAIAYLHLHPEVEIISFSGEYVGLRVSKYQVQVSVKGATISVDDSSWHPEFGVSLLSKKLCIEFQAKEASYQISWNKS